jgi:glycosyltransferase involved in cell wall biosynthesis
VSRLNIVVNGTVFAEWAGGIEFLRLMLKGLSASQTSASVTVYLLLVTRSRRLERQPFTPTSILSRSRRSLVRIRQAINYWMAGSVPTAALLEPSALVKEFRERGVQLIEYDGTQDSLTRVLDTLRATVLLPCIEIPPSDFPLPWLGYLADLQHKHYPDFFSPAEVQRRDEYMSNMTDRAKVIIVNARAVRDDIARYYPATKARLIALPFAPYPSEEWFHPVELNVFEHYKLPPRYFLVCNQFWVHKDHKTAFLALQEFYRKEGSLEVHMVCTGKMDEPRFPNYVPELLGQVRRLGLAGRIHFLGHVPKRHQIEIMKNCIALVQPTLCEGGPGGGAVYDAVALGIRAVASDIPVNLEIADPLVRFFSSSDPDDLARHMLQLSIEAPPVIDATERLSLGKARLQQLADALYGAIAVSTHLHQTARPDPAQSVQLGNVE